MCMIFSFLSLKQGFSNSNLSSKYYSSWKNDFSVTEPKMYHLYPSLDGLGMY